MMQVDFNRASENGCQYASLRIVEFRYEQYCRDAAVGFKKSLQNTSALLFHDDLNDCGQSISQQQYSSHAFAVRSQEQKRATGSIEMRVIEYQSK